MVSGNSIIMRKRIALNIQYDGTRFNGWQIQNSGITIQYEIERALEILTKKKIVLLHQGGLIQASMH